MASEDPPVTILNVDNNQGCRSALTRLLERNHFRVREASDGFEAVRVAQAELPGLVLLAGHLPDIDWLEVRSRLKSNLSTARIPVIHLAPSKLSGNHQAAGRENGVDSYRIEPVEPEALIALIHAALRAPPADDSSIEPGQDWRSTFDAISDGVAILDTAGGIRRCNQSFAAMMGRTIEELIGTPGAATLAELGNRHPLHRVLETGVRQSIEIDFDSRRLLVTVDPIPGQGGPPAGAVQIVHDITERRQLEEQVRESQKFETIGTLAGGVAHDFNNLLTSIMGNASLILSDMPPGSPHREKLDDIVSASHRAADLTRQLLAYSGKARHYMQKVQPGALVEQVRHLMEAAVPKKVELEFQLAPRLPSINADPGQVQQALLNLVSNAADAIGDENGRIVVSAGRENGGVFLEVKDSGSGMSPDIQERMFDPFFTTKFTGRGLGLAAVAGIARGHQATIRVTSAPGQGTAIRLILPALGGASPEPETLSGDLSAGRTVLVVDDEEMVRRIARAVLEERGYRVVMADNGLQAIGVARRHSEIGIVLLDLTMPVMGGAEAVSRILEACPGARVIVSTGYDRNDAAAQFPPGQVAAYLQKPYTSRQLAEAVKAVLGSRGAGG